MLKYDHVNAAYDDFQLLFMKICLSKYIGNEIAEGIAERREDSRRRGRGPGTERHWPVVRPSVYPLKDMETR